MRGKPIYNAFQNHQAFMTCWTHVMSRLWIYGCVKDEGLFTLVSIFDTARMN